MKKAILSQTDGCATAGQPDKDNWIVTGRLLKEVLDPIPIFGPNQFDSVDINAGLAVWSQGLASELCRVIFASARARVRGFTFAMSSCSFGCGLPANSRVQRDTMEGSEFL
jgi:hypothetical protein